MRNTFLLNIINEVIKWRGYPNIVKHLTCLISNQWRIALKLQQLFPNLKQLVEQVTLSTKDKQDKSTWNHNANGELPLKEVNMFKKQNYQTLDSAKDI